VELGRWVHGVGHPHPRMSAGVVAGEDDRIWD
jgi:hypothetical protein